MAWYLRDFGWDFEILAPSLSFQQPFWLDFQAEQYFAPSVSVTEAQPNLLTNALKRLGIRSVGWQALLPLYWAGSRLLLREKFDLVFFSTTAFNFFCLGRIWQRKFCTPYILDFHDPWYRTQASPRTTRHIWKQWVANKLASLMEGSAVTKAAGLVSVSPTYLAVLRDRYPAAKAFQAEANAVIPFGALLSDFNRLAQSRQVNRPLNIVYVGAGGVLMERGFRHLCLSLNRLRKSKPEMLDLFQIRLMGTDTDWAEGQRKVLEQQANDLGLGKLVCEDPTIIPYSASTAAASASDGLLVLGIDDPAYIASKLFSYAASGKPLLACIHIDSQMNEYFARYPELGTVVHFGGAEIDEAKEDAKVLGFLHEVLGGYRPNRRKLLEEFSAFGMTGKLVALFDKCIAQDPVD